MLWRLGPHELFVEDRLIGVRLAAPTVLDGPGQAAVPGGVESAAPLAERIHGGRLSRGRGCGCCGRPVLREPLAQLTAEPSLVGRVAEVHVPILRPDA